MTLNDEKKNKGQKTQERIIEKALELFGQYGFANTSMQMIADGCELSQGAVMQHFPSKLRLLEAVRKHVTHSNNQYVDSRLSITDDGFSSLKKHLKYNFEWALNHRAEANIIYLTYETGIYNSEYREVANGAARLGTERILRYVLSAQREKLIAPVESPELLAEIIQEYLLGMILRALSCSETKKVTSSSEKKLDFFLKTVLHYQSSELKPK